MDDTTESLLTNSLPNSLDEMDRQHYISGNAGNKWFPDPITGGMPECNI